MTEAQHTAHAAQMESAAMAAREEVLIAALREARGYLRPAESSRWVHPDIYAVDAIDRGLKAVGLKP
jgi:hypothetical protein